MRGQMVLPGCVAAVADAHPVELCNRGGGRWVALVDLVTSRRPRCGAIVVYVLSCDDTDRPMISDVIGRGESQEIGGYSCAAERSALLRSVWERKGLQ